MGTVADIARALLAVVFIVAGVAKLLDLQGARRMMAAFGVPPRFASKSGTVLPFLELATAVALVVQPTARWGGVAALVLLFVFIGGIANSLARGRNPNCNCFGQIAEAPVSSRTLVRNAVLAALAVIVVARGAGSSLFAWSGSRAAAEDIAILVALVVVGAAVAGLRLWRDKQSLQASYAQIQREVGLLPRGLPIGLRAPEFELPDVRGETVSLHSLCVRGRPVVLVFISPDCGPCIRLLPELARWKAALADHVTFAVLSNGGPQRAPVTEQLRTAGDFIALVQDEHEVADTYRVKATPAAIIVTTESRIDSALAGGPDEIEALVRVALRRPPAPEARPTGLVTQAA